MFGHEFAKDFAEIGGDCEVALFRIGSPEQNMNTPRRSSRAVVLHSGYPRSIIPPGPIFSPA